MEVQTTEPQAPAQAGGRHQHADDDEIVSNRAAATIINRSHHTLAQWRWKGIGPRFVRQGKRAIGYRRRDLREWMDAQTVSSTSE